MTKSSIAAQIQQGTLELSQLDSPQMVRLTLELFCPDRVTEIRALDVEGRNRRTDSGYFDDFAKAAGFVQRYVKDNKTRGVYFIPNTVPRDLLARAQNRIEEFAKATTTDDSIEQRTDLYIDFDPVRPSGISSTEVQLQTAIARAGEASEWLKEQGFGDSLLACSGNGSHLHNQIALRNTPESTELIRKVLKALSDRFSDNAVSVDLSVYNAARICRLYGTIARKGDNTSDRPHRMARILYVPDFWLAGNREACSPEALQQVASLAKPAQPTSIIRPALAPHESSRLLVEKYLAHFGVEYQVQTKGQFTNYVLSECVFNPEHKSPEACISQGSEGGLRYNCWHNSCQGKTWQDVRQAVGDPLPEHWDPPRASTAQAPKPHVTPFLEGERVRCGDRGNLGTVEQDDGGPNVRVHFESRDGNHASKWLPRHEVRSADENEESPVLQVEPWDAWDDVDATIELDEPVIEGLLRRGEVANVISAAKTGKSWMGTGLLWSVASGRHWLGRSTKGGNVLLVDNELRPSVIRHRQEMVRCAMGIQKSEQKGRFDVLSLRGKFAGIRDVLLYLKQRYQPGDLTLILLDAKYRFFGEGMDENRNSDQTVFHNLVDQLASDLNVAVVMIHHATKGDQNSKMVTDIGSGGGAQSRAVDTHIIIRPHQNEGFSVMDAACRSFPPVEPETIQWEFPVWQRASAVEPVLKQERPRSESRQDAKDMKDLGKLTDIMHQKKGLEMSRYDLQKAFGGGKDRLNKLIRLGIEQGRIRHTGTRPGRNGTEVDLFKLASYDEPQDDRTEQNANGLF